MEPTWVSREIPVLAATVELLEERGNIGVVTVREISERSGIDASAVLTSLLTMEDVYVEIHLVMAGGDPNPQMVSKVTPDARRLVGQWPTPEIITDRILEALSTAANVETDPVRKSRLRAIADDVIDVGKDVLVNVISAVLLGPQSGR